MKPLIMMQWSDVNNLRQQRGYAPPDDVLALYPNEGISAEHAMGILLQNGRVEDAVNLLACAITPRVGVWWAYLCLQSVLRDVEADRARDGLSPAERRQQGVAALAEKLGDSSDIDAMVEEQKKLIDAQVKELEQAARGQKYLNPAERIKLKMAWIRREFEALRSSLPPGRLGDDGAPPLMDSLIDQINSKSREDAGQIVQGMSPPEVPGDLPSSERIFEAIEQKTAAIAPAVGKEIDKYFPPKLKGLPKPPTPERRRGAVAAALRWLLAPSDANGQLACEAAMAAKEGPESMLAYAAFWSSAHLQTETGTAPANPALPPMGISKCLLQLAQMEGGEKDYDARYELFLSYGLNCADGTCTWNERGEEVYLTTTPPRTHDPSSQLRTRSGFGRP